MSYPSHCQEIINSRLVMLILFCGHFRRSDDSFEIDGSYGSEPRVYSKG